MCTCLCIHAIYKLICKSFVRVASLCYMVYRKCLLYGYEKMLIRKTRMFTFNLALLRVNTIETFDIVSGIYNVVESGLAVRI